MLSLFHSDKFPEVQFNPQTDYFQKARVHVVIDDPEGEKKMVVLFSGMLRPRFIIPPEKEYFYFLHAEELKAKMPPAYSIADLSQDVQRRGICVFLSRGGYFAGAIFRGKDMDAVVHKGFRRYVNRKGQGHRQSKHGSKQNGKKCRSGGGRLRAFNEKKQEDETIELLNAWKDELAKVASIWIGAPGRNKDVFMKHIAPELHERVHMVPLSTGRPTLKECTRIAKLLSNVGIVSNEEEDGDNLGENREDDDEEEEEEEGDDEEDEEDEEIDDE